MSSQVGVDQLREPILPRRRDHRRVPTHFFVGTLLLYALVLGVFLLNAAPGVREWKPNWRTLVPMSAGVSYYVCANLFLLILGRGRVSRWTVLLSTIVTLVLTVLLCLALRAALLEQRLPSDFQTARGLLDWLAAVVDHALAREGWIQGTIVTAGSIALEELIKLAPLFALVLAGRIQSAQGAMLCGALAGLTFGTVEAISYGYLNYPVMREPITTYLTRFFIMSPLHGIWDALAGGLLFFLSRQPCSNGRRGSDGWAFAAAFACAMTFHVIHNALQEIIGPVMQIVTVFALLAPMYYVAKAARGQAAAQGVADRGQLVGDLHLLTIALATLFLAAGVMFSWLLGTGV